MNCTNLQKVAHQILGWECNRAVNKMGFDSDRSEFKPTLPLICCVNLDKVLNLSKLCPLKWYLPNKIGVRIK